MNRQGDRESLSALIRKIREKVPGIVLRTTFMVGFPGETEEAFEELAEFAKEMRFERMGCFAYSQEEGTPAARLPDQISREIKEHRQELMMEQQMALMDEMSRKMVGETITVLQRQIHVFQNFILFCHDFQKFVGNPLRITVQHPNPADSLHLAKLCQKLRQFSLAIQILAIAGGILGDDHQLFYAPLGQLFRLR